MSGGSLRSAEMKRSNRRSTSAGFTELMPFVTGFEALARGVERDMFRDAGDDILQRAPFRHVIQHVIGGYQRYVLCASEGGQFAQFAAIAFATQHGGGKPHTARSLCRQ